MKFKKINIDIFHSITSDFIGIFLALFTSSILAYKLSLEGRGTIAFIQSSIAFLGFLTTPITSKYEIFLGKHKSEIRNSFLNSSFEIFIVCIFASTLLTFLIINPINTNDTFNIQLLVLSILNLFLIFFSQLYQRLLLARRMIKEINYLNIFSSFIYISCLLIFNSLNQLDIISVMNSYIIMSVYLVINYLYILLKLDKATDLKINKKIINFDFKFNKYIGVLLQEFVVIVFERGPIIFITQRFGLESAALYRIASTFQDLALKLPRILNFVFRGFSLSKTGGWRRVIISANIVISTFVSFITIPIILFLFGY